ncbi:MAG: AMP-binding protein [Myxococcales bacterium]|nr:AMP-binding protein [Myxococcales bacterium]MCB9532367.1 AMP-binding protein [Myxococcales bacterium]
MTTQPTPTRGDLDFTTAAQLPRIAAQRFGASLAIESDDVRLSFAELDAAVDDAAAALIAIGVDRGDRVALWAPNVGRWIVAALAIARAGGVIVPINTRYKAREAAYILDRAGARVLFTVNGFLGTNYVEALEALGGERPRLEQVVVLAGSTPPGALSWADLLSLATPAARAALGGREDGVGADDVADILFTSGTTGATKGVVATHAQNLRVFREWAETVGLEAGDRYLVVAPFFHTFGYKAGWLAALMMGATVLPQAVFDADAVLRRIGPDRVSVLPGPPALYQSLLMRDDLTNFELSSLRLAVTGAAVIPVELIHQMRERLGFRTIVTAYGLTECTGVATMCRPGDAAERVATTSGRAIRDVEVIVADRDARELPRGEAGEILVRGYNVTAGYLDDPDATREAVDQEGWLHTGDVGIMDEDGYLRITDRIKDMFIVGGFNAYPAEIENALLACPGIAQAAVIGTPDARLGEVGVAFVVSHGNGTSEDAVIAWARDNMANFKVPRRVVFVAELPRNASGKVQKFRLRELLEAQTAR